MKDSGPYRTPAKNARYNADPHIKRIYRKLRECLYGAGMWPEGDIAIDISVVKEAHCEPGFYRTIVTVNERVLHIERHIKGEEASKEAAVHSVENMPVARVRAKFGYNFYVMSASYDTDIQEAMNKLRNEGYTLMVDGNRIIGSYDKDALISCK